MSNSVDAFKRLLNTIPKADLDEGVQDVYKRYYEKSRIFNIELFLLPIFEKPISDAARSQFEYNTLYSKYKEFAKLSQELFDLSS